MLSPKDFEEWGKMWKKIKSQDPELTMPKGKLSLATKQYKTLPSFFFPNDYCNFTCLCYVECRLTEHEMNA